MRSPSFIAVVAVLLLTGTLLPLVHAQTQTAPALTVDASVGRLSSIAAKLEKVSGPAFDDVKSDDWFSSYVRSMAAWGIVSGYLHDDGTSAREFRPGNPVTVAEALKLVFRSAGIDETFCKRPPLNRQATTHWARSFVACAEEREIRLFQGPEVDLNRSLHRAELLVLVHDAFGDQVLPFFSDFKDTPGHRYEADIAFAVNRAMVTGDLDVSGKATGYFRPDANINRAEVTKILFNRLLATGKEPPGL